MTAIIVISAIILVFAFLLNMKIKAEISYLDSKFNFKVKYLCFTIFPFKEKKAKKEKIKKKKKESKKVHTEETEVSPNNEQTETAEQEYQTDHTEAKAETENKNKKKPKEPISEKLDKLFDIIEKVRIIWSVSKRHLIKIFRHIYIEEFMIDFIIGDEDAYTAAMNYGKINAAVYNLINFIRTFFTVTIKTVDIVCDFDSKKSVYDFSTKITVKPSTILSAVFGILFGLLINLKKLIGKNNTKQPSDKKAVST